MKRIFTILLLIFSANMFFSTEVNVTPGLPDALFNAVRSASAGDVLILADGGIYPNSKTLPVDVALTIKTEDGASEKARVELAANTSNNYPNNMIDADASISLKNIIFSGQKGTKSPYASRFIHRGNITGGKIHLDGVDVSRFTGVSMGGDCDTLILENSLFIGNLGVTGEWGGTWDWQGDIVKYVRIQNNTFMFCKFGPWLGDGWAHPVPLERQPSQVIIDHNTIYNITGSHAPTTTFMRTEKVQFTNNLYINGTFRPLETFSYTFFHNHPQNLDTLGTNASQISYLGPKGLWLISAEMCSTANTQIDMRSNNIGWTSDVLESWEEKGLDKPWVYTNETKMVVIDTNVAYFEEQLTFVDAPATPMFAIDSIAVHCANGMADPVKYHDTKTYYGWDWWDGNDATFDLRERADMDMSYNKDARSFTEGTSGYPLGDLNWWGQVVVDAYSNGDSNPLTSVNDVSIQPDAFGLLQNYPNPFNPTTKITYTLKSEGDLQLTVYNTLGQKVKTLVNQKVAAGEFTAHWDGTNATGEKVVSGVYLYKLKAGKYSKTMKMLLLN